MMPFQKLVLAVVATTVALPTVALADAPPAQVEFIRGRITSITAEQVQVKTTAGKIETVNLAPKWTVQVTKPISVSEIKTGSFIGTAEMPQKDGTGRSLEVHVFPAGVKAGEGHYSWGLKKGSMMTNGTVGTIRACELCGSVIGLKETKNHGLLCPRCTDYLANPLFLAAVAYYTKSPR